MSSKAYVKQNTRPVFTSILKGDDGSIQDLSGASVKFRAKLVGASVYSINSDCDVTDDVGGAVRYQSALGDWVVSGEFVQEWYVTLVDGRPLAFPSRDFNTIIVADMLTNG